MLLILISSYSLFTLPQSQTKRLVELKIHSSATLGKVHFFITPCPDSTYTRMYMLKVRMYSKSSRMSILKCAVAQCSQVGYCFVKKFLELMGVVEQNLGR